MKAPGADTIKAQDRISCYISKEVFTRRLLLIVIIVLLFLALCVVVFAEDKETIDCVTLQVVSPQALTFLW